jgi:isopropylmalate/homocitrate/citramalate synthase
MPIINDTTLRDGEQSAGRAFSIEEKIEIAKYMDENGTFSFEKAKPIVYSHGWYYGLGKKIGKFGYSVIKKKAAKNIRKKVKSCFKN